MPILSKQSPLIPYSLESQSQFMELTSYVNSPFNTVSTIRWTQSLEDMIRVMNPSDLHPFDKVQIIRDGYGNGKKIQFVRNRWAKADLNPDHSLRPINSIPSASAMTAIHSRSRGIDEPKPYNHYLKSKGKSWLELSQPKEKDPEY